VTATPRRFDLSLPPMRLACGARLDRVVVRGQHLGPDGDARDLARIVDLRPDDPASSGQITRRTVTEQDAVPAPRAGGLSSDVPTVLVVHALTADARVAGEGGWWSDRVGPGLPFDPRLVRVLCLNNLGSCYGTSGPADEGFATLAEATDPWPDAATWTKGRFELPTGSLPAPITTWDQARVILATLDALGVHTVDLLIGGSVGGMVALALAALAPERFPRLVPIATLDRATPWIIGWNHIARQAIARALADGDDATEALSLARQIAHMTYRANAGLVARHGRKQIGVDDRPGAWSAHAPYTVQTYLQHQGSKLVARFAPKAYLSQLDAMDHHDLDVPPPAPDAHETWSVQGPWTGLSRITGRMDAVAIQSDELFFAADLHDLVVRHRAGGRAASWTLLWSPHGHDAFLMTSRVMDDTLRAAVRRIDPERLP